MKTRVHVTNGLVLSPDQASAEPVDLILEAGRISDIVARDTAVGDVADVVDASDRLIIPGLVNAHTHSQLTLSKGVNDRWNLELLLNAFPWLGGKRNPEIHYVSALLGAAELIRKGCTTAFDLFSEFPAPTTAGLEAVARAYADLGMRAVVAPMMADRSFYQAIPALLEAFPVAMREEVEAIRFAPHQESIARCRAILDAWPADRDRVRPALAPTIPHHCSDEFLIACRDLAREYDIAMQMHVAESRLQAVVAPMVHDGTAVAHLERLGLLGPRFTAAHAVWISDDDARRLADHGCSVAHNPGSNMRLGSGLAPIRRYLDAGVNVAIGTDGAITSDSLNMIEAIRLATFASRMHDLDVERWLSAGEALRAGTLAGARALGFEGQIGTIAKGYRADLVFLDLSAGPFVPLNHAPNQLVYGEDGSAIKTVMVDGRVLYHEGQFVTIDYPSLVGRARTMAAELAVETSDLRSMVERFEPIVQQYCAGLATAPLGLRRLCVH